MYNEHINKNWYFQPNNETYENRFNCSKDLNVYKRENIHKKSV